MDKQFTVELLIATWNEYFPTYPLTTEDLKKPQSMMGALFQVFDLLNIDPEAIVSPPPEEERNESLNLYWDLIPVINATRAVNHLIMLTQNSITITMLLQPTLNTSQSLLLILYNVIIFREERVSHIAPFEQELFSQADKVTALKDKKNSVIEMINKQFAGKAERAGRLKKIDREMKQHEEELTQEKEALDKEKQELEEIQMECRQLDATVEQKKGQRDALVAEVNKKRVLRVYDADDIKAQVEQAAKNVTDAEEKLNTLRTTLMQKENSLKNLQSIKPNLDIANNLLYDIMKQSDSLRDYETGDADSKEDELGELTAELSELEAQFAELTSARAEADSKRREASLRRQQERAKAQSNLREMEETDKKGAEKCKKAAQNVIELQKLTAQYEEEKTAKINMLMDMKENYTNQIKTINEAVLKVTRQAQEKIEAKIPKRRG
ncbi:golgin subfamily A member 6-like protein 7 [Bicyclus anynana]|uniref:Golgin subfamily A member 6-like protein 7 n=1 Tax=Bicyclus anynana TaxID=110368 RepID=A0A6J1PBC1_BICAN|nr:golgin subfamily A member 6-like protein 7 [Bicyclus anynana]